MKTKKTVLTSIILLIGILVLLNVVADKFFLRLDFTEDKRYTLSNASKDILEALENPVTITAYFSENLPPDIAKTRSNFRDLLIEYANLADGNLVYEFVNPNEDEESERKAMQNGISPVVINVREKDQVKQQKAFLGAVVQMGEEKDIIPFLQPGAAMEYALSSAIKKLSLIDKPLIGLLQGHGEPSLTQFRQVYASLSVLYEVEEVVLKDSLESNSLSKYETIAIISPKDSIPQSHFYQLDNYLAQGKNLFIAFDRVEGKLQQNPPMGVSLTTGLETWLSQKGLTVENNFIIDAQCGQIQVRQPNFPFPVSMSFPYLPIVSNFAEHPITKGLEAVVMQFASSITFTGDTSLRFTPIVKSSEKSGTQSVPLYFDVSKDWQEQDFPLSNLTIGAVLSGKIQGEQNANIILISDGNFPVSAEGQQLQPDNVSLMVNAIDWLSDDTGLIELRTKGVSLRPLAQLDDATKAVIKYANFFVPIITIIFYGIFRMQYNRNLRIKRMEENYV